MGEPVHKLVQREVFDPLRMNSSALAPQYLMTNNRTYPHNKNGNRGKNKREIVPEIIDYVNRMPRYSNAAGTMWSSIQDYTNFMFHLFHDTEYHPSKIRKLMMAEQVYYQDWEVHWGLGIGIEKIMDKKFAWHWGSDMGFKTFTYTSIDDKKGVTIFTNGENGYFVYKKILETILSHTPNFIENKE